jgi:trk system potassium uptake protein TrkH
VFEVVTVVTSTGFGTVDFSEWPDFLPVLLMFISFVGGCGGSTAGGMKVMRMMLIALQGRIEVLKLVHPRAVLPLRIGRRVVGPGTMEAVWGFFAAYMISFVILMLLMMHVGLDQVSAFSAIATSMNNLGPGLGQVAYSFASVSDGGKMIAAFAMLLGRLEVFTILVLLTPAFWRG